MESDYIKRSDALAALEAERAILLERKQYGAEHILLKHAINVIEDLPIEDVVATEKGEWIWNDYGSGFGNYHCSICHEAWVGIQNYNYCPHCGARMTERNFYT